MRTAIASLLAAFCFAAPALAEDRWVDDLSSIGKDDWNRARAAHLLERAGFGGTPDEVDRLAGMSPTDAVDFLVEYQRQDDSGLPAFEPSGIYPNGHKLVPLDQIVLEGLLTGKAYGIVAMQKGKLKYQPTVNEFYTLLISEHAEMRRASQWWAERMLRTPRPLQEKLTLFWHDHFATSQEKVLNYELMLAQIETLRKNGGGNLRELLIAVAQDPAMLVWLDNKDNVKGKPNENFAREVMELFAMGEGQGYTEADIREMARAFTGWTTKPARRSTDEVKFIDNPRLHDDGEKSFLGAKGNFAGSDAIDIILKQPATARFVSRKLYRFFVRENLSPALEAKLAQTLLDAKYEVRPFLKALFLSRDFYSEATVGTQIKSPTQFLVGTYRKLGLKSVPGYPDYAETAGSLGQLPFYPPNVAGWPGGRAWINPATLLARGNFAQGLLFPDPEKFVAPDKLIGEGYRKIPQMFPQYGIVPHVWDAKTGKMVPISLKEYEQYYAALDDGNAKAMGGAVTGAMPAKEMKGPVIEGGEGKSRMSRLADSEDFNLAVGVYSGWVEAGRRVKPIARQAAQADFVAMLKGAKAETPESAVDALCLRFLSVRLSDDRRAAIVAFLRKELPDGKLDLTREGIDRVLRRTAHLILSAPEYQVG